MVSMGFSFKPGDDMDILTEKTTRDLNMKSAVGIRNLPAAQRPLLQGTIRRVHTTSAQKRKKDHGLPGQRHLFTSPYFKASLVETYKNLRS